MTTVSPEAGVGLAPLRAAAIARQLLGLVESGYFERKPHVDEQITATWLTRAIAELDRLRTVREPSAVLDRLDSLLVELAEFPVPESELILSGKSQLATAN
jgi:hypothetical protein